VDEGASTGIFHVITQANDRLALYEEEQGRFRRRVFGYEGMAIPRVKGKRREVRRMLARRSHELLERYRKGEPVGEECPLKKALPT